MSDLYLWETKFKYCCYSKRLLKKLLLINKTAIPKINILKIKKAIYYARKYHGSQKRGSGEPFYSHPLEVTYNVADCFFTTDILVTSILHDAIEDTLLTKQMIDGLFGSVIASNIEDLTRIKEVGKISAAEMMELLYSQRKKELLTIKIFDRMHNLQTINIKTPQKIEATILETLRRFLTACMYCDLKNIENKLNNLCRRLDPNQKLFLDQWSYFLSCDNFLLPSPIFRNKIIQNYNQ